eukprot:scaffold80380_cov60-Phaeocystis_antarctica.AAC.2
MSAKLGGQMQIGIQKLNQAQERLRQTGWELALCKAEERALDEWSFGQTIPARAALGGRRGR